MLSLICCQLVYFFFIFWIAIVANYNFSSYVILQHDLSSVEHIAYVTCINSNHFLNMKLYNFTLPTIERNGVLHEWCLYDDTVTHIEVIAGCRLLSSFTKHVPIVILPLQFIHPSLSPSLFEICLSRDNSTS